jgi:hypothetical protein
VVRRRRYAAIKLRRKTYACKITVGGEKNTRVMLG